MPALKTQGGYLMAVCQVASERDLREKINSWLCRSIFGGQLVNSTSTSTCLQAYNYVKLNLLRFANNLCQVDEPFRLFC